MRKIGKKLIRETAARERGRAIVLTLHPKFMTLHLKSTREAYNLDYEAAFSLAAKHSIGGKA